MQKNLIIWWSTWDFYRITNTRNNDEQISNYFAIAEANALELMFHSKESLEYQLTKETIEKNFSHCSIHAPKHAYKDDETSHKILRFIGDVCALLPIKNIVIHPDIVIDRAIFEQYKHLPLSIENMDERTKSCQWVQDIKKILNDNPYLWLVLDLQHCFTNDPTMQLAKDFHREFWDRIVQYHISWYHPEHLHYPLFKTQQIQIIKAIEKTDIPIIIESTFDDKGDLQKEIEYIKSFM
ncbi:MAG: hypothetical protein ACD_80C00166G0017 [uncultured bacterium (gcode 4)]|uniref:Xylose isomerase-like TIM barrel domain-containing protein n=1 Tax=uncultured bacterium (gcode 4) TaxID=1234023 RepID=K1XHN5_9BACT|nr:MAG: hypothetical protein ACD_80C00166G0017 [uncultured bacterium (gcode 4)]